MHYNPHKRQGQMDYLQAFFYTDTIAGHKHLLANDDFKMMVIESWKYLIAKKKIKIYAFVMMPNHIYFLWQMVEMDGKETPAESFAIFTAHEFKKSLLKSNPTELSIYKIFKGDRSYRFLKRDPLAVTISNAPILKQRLDNIYNNPVHSKWNLAKLP